MNQEETKKCSDCICEQSTEEWLEEVYRSYAALMAIVTGAAAYGGNIKLRDVLLAERMTKTLVTISNLIEKERKQTRA